MAELVGFESARIGIYNSFNDEHVDPDKIFSIDAENGGTMGANIQNLNYAVAKQYASDIAFKISGKGHGDITCAFTAADIPPDVLNEITGATKNAQGIYVVTKDTQAPYCVLEMISHDSDGKMVYLALLKGQFGYPDRNPQTNQATETDVTDALTFTAIDRQSDSAAYAEAYEADPDFNPSNWANFVFPGADNLNVSVSGLSLDKVSASVAVGATTQLTATVLPDNVTNKNIVWSSSDATKATVDATGLVTGVAAGSVVITAKSQDDSTKQAIANITVTA
jgi:phi13 family phage major tail protein